MPDAPGLSDQGILIRSILGRAREAFTARGTWFNNQLKSQSIRRGILQDIDWPYPGAANPNIPGTDAIVRRKKSACLNVLGIRPHVIIEIPQENTSPRLGWRLQQWMGDTYDEMKVRRYYEALVDGWLERSSFFVKVGRKYQREYRDTVIDLDKMGELDQVLFSALEVLSLPEAFAAAYKMDLEDPKDAKEIAKAVKQYEAGKRRIRLKRKIVTADLPEWMVIEGPDLIRAAGAKKDIQEHRWLIHRFKKTVAEIRKDVQDKVYEKVALEQVKQAKQSDVFDGDSEQSQQAAQAIAEGLATPTLFSATNSDPAETDDLEIEIYEAYLWYSPDVDSEPARRAKLTFFPAYHNGSFIRTEWLEETYWPFQEFDYDNPSNNTYGGRSVPLMNESLAVETNMLHKAFLDILPWIAGMAGTYDPDKMIGQNGAAFSLSPGEFLPARGVALNPVDAPTAGTEILNEANNLQSQGENLFGPLQATLNRRGKGGDPTKYEVQVQQGEDNSLQAMEIDSFQESMNAVHQMTLDDMIKNMPPVVRFPYKGPGGEMLFDQITREELEGLRPRVKAHGNLRNSNPDTEIQWLQGLLGMAENLAKFGVMIDVRKIAQRIVALRGERNPQELIPDAPQGMPGMGMAPGMGGPGVQDPRMALLAQAGGPGGAPPGGPAPLAPPGVPVGAGAAA